MAGSVEYEVTIESARMRLVSTVASAELADAIDELVSKSTLASAEVTDAPDVGAVWVPDRVVASATTTPEGDAGVVVVVETGDDGQPRVTSVTVVREDGVAATDLRDVSIPDLLVAVIGEVAMVGPPAEPGRRDVGGERDDPLPLRLGSWGGEPSGRQRLTDEHLAAVASVYVDALAAGRATARTVAGRWNVSESTARRWVAKAREAGLLTETEERRAGGHLTAKAKRLLGRRQDG